jgi:hypothetical protein
VDLNRLYFDHQLSLMRASRSRTSDAPCGEALRASRIARRIGCVQRALGAGAAPGWECQVGRPRLQAS